MSDHTEIILRLEHLHAMAHGCARKIDLILGVLQTMQPSPAIQKAIEEIDAETKRILEAVAKAKAPGA